mgnify:CR=1 FL=1
MIMPDIVEIYNSLMYTYKNTMVQEILMLIDQQQPSIIIQDLLVNALLVVIILERSIYLRPMLLEKILVLYNQTIQHDNMLQDRHLYLTDCPELVHNYYYEYKSVDPVHK